MIANNTNPGDFWVKELVARTQSKSLLVIDDLRFPVEYDMLKEQGYTIVKLLCDRDVCEQRLIKRDGSFDPKMWDHESEKHFVGFSADVVLDATKNKHSILSDLLFSLEAK